MLFSGTIVFQGSDFLFAFVCWLNFEIYYAITLKEFIIVPKRSRFCIRLISFSVIANLAENQDQMSCIGMLFLNMVFIEIFRF